MWGANLKLVRAEVYVCNYNVLATSNPREPIKPLCEYKGTITMTKEEIRHYLPTNITPNLSYNITLG